MAQAIRATKTGGGSERAVACRLDRLLSPRLFKALSDPSRLGLLVQLAEAGKPRTVGEVARGSHVDLSVVSRHLAVLREASIIECVRRGKEVWCSIRAGAVVQLLRDLADAIEACCPPESEAAPPRRSRR